MEWIVNIENKPNIQILVKFEPNIESIKLIGQYKPKNKPIIDFSEEIISMNVDFDKLQEALFKVYETLNNRLIVYNKLTEAFKIIKIIEIIDD